MSEELVQALLNDRRSAQISQRLQAMLAFLEKLVLMPTQVEPEDITPLRQVGLSDQDIEDALYVSSYFQMINRLADAFDVSILSKEQFTLAAIYLLAHGYQ